MIERKTIVFTPESCDIFVIINCSVLRIRLSGDKMSKLTVKELDARVTGLQAYFQDELGKFKTEINNVKSPDIPATGDPDKWRNFITKFGFFEATINNKMHELEKQVSDIKRQMDEMYVRCDDLLQLTNRNKVIFYGIQTLTGETLKNRIVEIINSKLNISIQDKDIANCYRVGRKKADDKKQRPVIAEFYNWRMRDDILVERRRFKGTKIVCTEVLSPLRYKVYSAARQKLPNHCWTFRGKIGFLQGNNVRYVTTMTQFNDILQTGGEVPSGPSGECQSSQGGD